MQIRPLQRQFLPVLTPSRTWSQEVFKVGSHLKVSVLEFWEPRQDLLLLLPLWQIQDRWGTPWYAPSPLTSRDKPAVLSRMMFHCWRLKWLWIQLEKARGHTKLSPAQGSKLRWLWAFLFTCQLQFWKFIPFIPWELIWIAQIFLYEDIFPS